MNKSNNKVMIMIIKQKYLSIVDQYYQYSDDKE